MSHPLEQPMPRQKQRMIEQANQLRGMLVGSYSQVEYLIGNLWVSMQHIEPYLTQPRNFPYRQLSRVKAVKHLFEVPGGPLFQFRDAAIALLDEMDAYETHRHMMAHGYMEVEHSASGYLVRVRFYQPAKEDPAHEQIVELSLNGMRADAAKAADFTGRWIRLHFDIHTHFGWVAPAVHLTSSKSHGVVVQARYQP